MSADFIDTNIFVYLFDDVNVHKRDVAEKLVRSALDSGNAAISYQVVQETLNVITRKLKPPMSAPDASRFMQALLQPLWQVMPTQELFYRGLQLQVNFSLSFYDAMIVAAAQEAGCKRLFSEDMQSGQVFDQVKIVNPFNA